MEAIRCQGVSKRFVIQHERARTFQEVALQLFGARRRRAAKEEFWALRDVTFTVSRGRTLGIVGRNGSGKSTLLKLLSGTLRPTTGRITTHGKVFGLLELAAGFHPELSGRENVFLNGAYLGHSRAQMARRMDQIVAFSELEQFINTPVKHYSSGMYMRLGFAIAISVDPDILIIDEVLAVGDAAFRQKCFLALADFKRRGKTILFVTHDSAAVRRFCDEAIWLDHGHVRGAGTADDVLREYLAATQPARGPELSVAARAADPLSEPAGPLRLLSVETVDPHGRGERHFRTGEAAGIRVRYTADRPVAGVSIGVAVHRADGLYLAGTSTGAAGHTMAVTAGEGEATCWLGPLPLPAAEYAVSAQAWTNGSPVHRLSHAFRFAVRPPRIDQSGALVLAPTWEAAGALQPAASVVAAPVPALVGANGAASRRAASQVPPRPGGGVWAGGFIPGTSEDQALPAGGFYARWRPAPSGIVMGEGEDEFLGPGWYPPEDWPPRIRWTSRRAMVYLTQPDWASTVVITMCRPQHEARAARGRLLVDGRVAGSFELASPTLEPLSFTLGPVTAPREVEITLEVENPLEPASDGGRSASDDHRILGVAVHSLALE